MTDALTSSLQGLLEQLAETHHIPAIAVGVKRDAQPGIHVRYGERVIFPAASLTKPVFAYAALKLSAAGVLDLDQPVQHYFDEGYYTGPFADQITARHILSHAAGFPNWRPEGGVLASLWQPGTGYNYSGEGYFYLQHALQKLTGLSLAALLEREVFAPCGMTASRIPPRVDDPNPWLPVELGHLPNAAFSLETSTDDYLRFMEVLLTDPNAAAMHVPRVTLPDYPQLAWAVGWGLQTTDGGDSLFWQWGASKQFRHLAIGRRETGEAVVILTDAENGLEICETILREVSNLSAEAMMKWLLPPSNWRADGRKPEVIHE